MNSDLHTGNAEISWKALRDHVGAGTAKVFLVAGKRSFEQSGAAEKFRQAVAGCEVVHFNGYSENPQIEEVRAALDVWNADPCDLIVAIGGGSAMDTAKVIHMLADRDPADHLDLVKGVKKVADDKGPDRKLLAVPTTFGTGSESTHFAVVYIGDSKYSVAHPAMLPTGYILDPQLGLSAPSGVRATTATDALCQALESYWARAATDESRGYAAEAIRRASKHLLAYSTEGATIAEAREMACAANFSGRAINVTKTTAPHALSYGITKKFDVPHGLAVAMTLPAFFELNVSRGDDQVQGRMKELFDLLEVSSAKEAAVWFRNLIESSGQPTSLRAARSVSASDIETLASQVNIERLRNHPVPLAHEDLVAALQQ